MDKESLLLNAAFIDRSSYEFLTRLDFKSELSPIGTIIWEETCRYYNNDDKAEECNQEIILSRMEREYPKHVGLLAQVVSGFEPVLSVPNILEEYKDLCQENLSNELAQLLLEPSPNNRRKTLELMDKYRGVEEAVQELHSTPLIFGAHPDDFMDDVLGSNTIKLFPKALNEKIGGGAPKGSHILVFARPEAGKSLISINLAYGFCKQGARTLYVGNEDPESVMWNRFLSRFSGMDRYQIVANKQRAYEQAKEHNYDNLAFIHMAPGSCSEIERIVKQAAERGSPFDCLVVDQLRNLRAKSSNKTEGLEENAIGIRGIAQRHHLVAVSVTQAGDSADGKLELTMGDVDYSNTGIPAQVDVMIGVGVTPEYDRGGIRYLSFPKNKLGNDHTGCLVRVEPRLSKAMSE